MKYEAREVSDAELAESDLEQVTGGIFDGNAGQVARYVVKMWLLDYQIKSYDAAVEAARRG